MAKILPRPKPRYEAAPPPPTPAPTPPPAPPSPTPAPSPTPSPPPSPAPSPAAPPVFAPGEILPAGWRRWQRDLAAREFGYSGDLADGGTALSRWLTADPEREQRWQDLRGRAIANGGMLPPATATATPSTPAPTPAPAPAQSTAPSTVQSPATTPAPPPLPLPPEQDPEQAAEQTYTRRRRGLTGTVATSWRGVLLPGAAAPARKRLLGE